MDDRRFVLGYLPIGRSPFDTSRLLLLTEELKGG
jgi:hypothetical protein